MKFVNFESLLTGEPATLAILSTYQFDPDYFERRVLTSPAFQKARRIVVYMDARQWFNLLHQDYPARLVNRRYLLVPVTRAGGVFHPKLSLLVTAHGARVLCGSNNLTRGGCSRNLEILNAFEVKAEGKDEEARALAIETFAFFQRACDDVEESTRSLAREWLDELSSSVPWVTSATELQQRRRVRLIHTYEGPIWGRVNDRLAADPPKRLMIISPFYDSDAKLVHRINKRWPKCEIELVVQQNTTTLDVARLHDLQGRITLAELRNSSRRLHAKLFAWQSSKGAGCLTGSANFTSAAFDGRNVEACVLIENAESELDALFDRNLDKRTIDFGDFEPGVESEPEPSTDSLPDLRLTSAVLGLEGNLRVVYQHRLATAPSALRIAIRVPGEALPRVMLDVPVRSLASVVDLPETAIADAHGTLLASLIAESGSGKSESSPVWVVQEARLTYEPSGGGSSSGDSKVEETGEGLPEFIEELGQREGISAVVEYLRHLNIKFSDGGDGKLVARPFVLRMRDPFRADIAPHWLLESGTKGVPLADAIYEFADRHEYQRLRRHSKRGNINGIENFLDVLVALVRLLYIYYVRGVVPRGQLLGRLYRYLWISTAGIDNSDDYSEGYLYTVYENLGHDSSYLKEVDSEVRFLPHLWGILLLAQAVRRTGDEHLPRRKALGEYLPSFVAILREARRHLALEAPTVDSVADVLRGYNMLTSSQIEILISEFPS